MKENAPKLFFVSALFVVITTVMSELEYRLPGTSSAYFRYIEQIAYGEPHSAELLLSYLTPYGVILALFLILVRPVIEVGFRSYCLKTSRALGGDYKDVLDGFAFTMKVIMLFIITSIFIMLWSLLFIIPAIPAYYRYRLAYYILLDDPSKSPLECINESKRLMDGHKLDLFLIDLSFIGWYVFSLSVSILIPLPFAFPIVSVWLSPYHGLALAMYYDRLRDNAAL